MQVSGPCTPGQVSFLLGFCHLFVAWVYSEILEYRKASFPPKVHSDISLVDLENETVTEKDQSVLLEGGLSTSASPKFQNAYVRANLISHSDMSVVDLEKETSKEEDQSVLLEGGLSRSASQKFQNAYVRANLIRFIRMDDSFLLENRALLRSMSEFGCILVYLYICDRTNLFSESTKNYSRDLFLFLYGLLIIAAGFTSLKKHNDKSAFSGKSILYLNRHQTEEWKGWMQVSRQN